jgi:multidrug transporter EmrE-like cation transporter
MDIAVESARKGNKTMSGARIAAIVLIVAGVLGLAYGGFTYTKSTHDAKLGPFEFSIKDKESVNIPVWAGVAAIVAGVVIFVRKKSSS